MKYIVYKTINLLTGQYYYGKHKQLSESFDEYFGSSPALVKDILHFGKEYFVRETLFEFDSEEECYLKEREIIADKWKFDPLCYNKQPGGKGFSSGDNHYSSLGGFSSQHIENLKKSRKKRPPASLETRAKMSKSRTGSRRNDATKKKMSIAQSGKNNPMYGKKHSLKTKKLIGEKLKKKYIGEKSSSFKGYYITPFGKFLTVKEIKENISNISPGTVFAWCKNCDKQITKNMVGMSKFLTSDMVGKTFREIGFQFERK